MQTITLCYKRVPGDLSTGLFTLTSPPETSVIETFENEDFIGMMKRLARLLSVYLDVEAAVQRIDRPGLVALRFSQEEVDLFRADPAEAIRRRTFSPQVVHIGGEKPIPEAAVNMVPPLEAGLDAVAECFGDTVFLNARPNGQVECACCGEWTDTQQSYERFYVCDYCDCMVTLTEWHPQERWAGVDVVEVLKQECPAFFLPRRWNPEGKWISRDTLLKLHNNYQNEKESLSCKAIP